MAWQPIETAPHDGAHILVRGGQNDPYLCAVAHYFNDGFYLSWNRDDDASDYGMAGITEWQPLPA